MFSTHRQQEGSELWGYKVIPHSLLKGKSPLTA